MTTSLRVPVLEHMRRGRYSRLARAKHLITWLAAIQTALNGTAAAGKTITASASINVVCTAHALLANSGPYVVTNSGGALPAGMIAGELYFIKTVVDANTLNLCTKLGGPAILFAGAGTGTHTMKRAETKEAIYEYVRRNGSRVVKAATDGDNL